VNHLQFNYYLSVKIKKGFRSEWIKQIIPGIWWIV